MTITDPRRPVQPSIRKHLAIAWALNDPRCMWDEHNEIERGGTCPRCHLDLFTYLQSMPQVWP